jgi:hypothetical protein
MINTNGKIKIKILLPKFYTYITLIFFIGSIALSAGFVYYVFGKVKITITPTYEKLSWETSVAVKDNIGSDAIGVQSSPGMLEPFEVDGDVLIPATGEKTITEEGIGKVTIVNNGAKSQPLIATTRLVAPDGTLLRLKDRVVVPAHQNIDAAVYPDKPEEFSTLSPTKFIFPGLSDELKKVIYAENKNILSSGEKKIRVISQDDMKKIDAAVLESLNDKIQEKARGYIQDIYTELVSKEVVEKQTDAKAGDEVESFTVKAKIKAVAVLFDEKRVIDKVKKGISESLAEGKEIKDLDPKSIVYTIEKYNIDDGTAQIKIFVEGRVQVKQDNKIFNKEMIYGKSKADIEKYFKEYGEIGKVNVEFFPSWIPRAPRTNEKIDIVVE